MPSPDGGPGRRRRGRAARDGVGRACRACGSTGARPPGRWRCWPASACCRSWPGRCWTRPSRAPLDPRVGLPQPGEVAAAKRGRRRRRRGRRRPRGRARARRRARAFTARGQRREGPRGECEGKGESGEGSLGGRRGIPAVGGLGIRIRCRCPPRRLRLPRAGSGTRARSSAGARRPLRLPCRPGSVARRPARAAALPPPTRSSGPSSADRCHIVHRPRCQMWIVSTAAQLSGPASPRRARRRASPRCRRAGRRSRCRGRSSR